MELTSNTFYICKVCGTINYGNGCYEKEQTHCQKCGDTQKASLITDLSKKLLVRNTTRLLSDKISNFSKFDLIFEKSNKTYDFSGAIAELEGKDLEEMSNSEICEIIEKHIKEVKKTAVVVYHFKFDNSLGSDEEQIQLFKNDEKLVAVHSKLKSFFKLYNKNDFVPEEIAPYVKYGSVWDNHHLYNSILNTFRNPYKEILVKSGFGKLHLDDWRFNTQGRNPADILQVNKDKAKFLNKMLNASDEDHEKKYYDFGGFEKFWNLFQAKKDMDLMELKKYLDLILENCSGVNYDNLAGRNQLFGYNYNYQNTRINLDHVLELMDLSRTHNIKMDRLFEYLTVDVREKQGIASLYIAVSAYREYIRYVDELNAEYEKYPLSLIQAHDKLAWQKAVQSVEVNKNIFKTHVENYKKYEYENSVYAIITPNEMEDMKKEGDALNNCVATYIESYLKGKSKVFFMRKKEDMTKSLIAVELNSCNNLVQERGYNNRSLNQEERTFVREWLQYVKDVDAGIINKDIKQEEFNCAV